MSKSNNLIKKKDFAPKIAYDMYFDYIDFREKPVSENFVMRTAQEFVDWCFHSKGTKVSQFFKSKGIDSRTYYRWYDKWPKFADAYNFGLQVLGDKREQGAIDKKFEVSMIRARMHAYDPEWIKTDNYHAELRARHAPENQISGNFTIIQEPIPVTDEVDKQLKKRNKDA